MGPSILSKVKRDQPKKVVPKPNNTDITLGASHTEIVHFEPGLYGERTMVDDSDQPRGQK